MFTEAERGYAAARARPARHLAARFCAKEAVAKALGLTGWSYRDVEVVATDAAPRVALSEAAARARELHCEVRISSTHTDATAGAVAVALAASAGEQAPGAVLPPGPDEPALPREVTSALPDWLDPLYEAAEMRALDAWAIEERGVPSLDLMERAGIGLARVAAAVAQPRGAGFVSRWPLRS